MYILILVNRSYDLFKNHTGSLLPLTNHSITVSWKKNRCQSSFNDLTSLKNFPTIDDFERVLLQSNFVMDSCKMQYTELKPLKGTLLETVKVNISLMENKNKSDSRADVIALIEDGKLILDETTAL
jgi:hypothetical protein